MAKLCCIRCSFSGTSEEFVKGKTVCLPCERARRAAWRDKNRARLAEAGGPLAEGTRTCTKCGVEKPRLQFSTCPSTSDGRHPWCLVCTGSNTKAQKSAGAGREKKLAAKKRYRANMTPEQQAAERARLDAAQNRAAERKRAAAQAAYAADHRAHVDAYREHLAALKAQKRLAAELRRAAGPQIPPGAGPGRVKKLRRKHAERRQTPPWADKKLTAAIYAQARQFSKIFGFQIDPDHIVPLRSELVSGLHWHGNLQILPREYNVAKGNKTWPGMP